MTFHESPHEAKLWVIRQIAKFITETQGKGTFREFNDYLGIGYADSYDAGGMTITNAVMPFTRKKQNDVNRYPINCG